LINRIKSRGFSIDSKEYYQALEAFEKKEELEPLVSFLKGQLEKTWEKRS
jgi:hypothetical protein